MAEHTDNCGSSSQKNSGCRQLLTVDNKLYLQSKCDHCGAEIYKRTQRSIMSRQFHFCSRDCLNESQRTGCVKGHKQKHFIQKYGVDNPFSAAEVIGKQRQTMLAKYGVDNISKVAEVRTKKSATMKKLLAETDIRSRTEKTCLERYGASSYLGTRQAHEQLKTAIRAKYGVDYYGQSEESIARITALMSDERVKSKSRNTCLSKYGVDNVFKRDDVVKKRVDAVLRNAAKSSSVAEDRAYEFLCEMFGRENVVRQVEIKYKENASWLIDFYIESIDAYVQFDGVFWHGIDCDRNELVEAARTGDKIAKMQLRAKRRDHFQDVWFLKHGCVLLRIIEGMSHDDIVALFEQARDKIVNRSEDNDGNVR